MEGLNEVERCITASIFFKQHLNRINSGRYLNVLRLNAVNLVCAEHTDLLNSL